MTDRELLELAAKAAGYDVEYAEVNVSNGPDGSFYFRRDGRISHHKYDLWSPLTDDGDALRLAVALSMDIVINQITALAGDITPGGIMHKENVHNGDRNAATRRAIVKAAAALAKGTAEG